MGPVQFTCPRGLAEDSFSKPGFWEHLVDCTWKNTQKKTESLLCFLQSGPWTFTKSTLRVDPDPVSSECLTVKNSDPHPHPPPKSTKSYVDFLRKTGFTKFGGFGARLPFFPRKTDKKAYGRAPKYRTKGCSRY